ncbi:MULTISPECIES: hypothetical protein [Treponema]|jgi:hypothetical protein|uniref:Uncharacterized protein n=1 Tax=Treponema rectale TaxID=744512 RepID=A0A840SDF2_9SPIR|nr:MULTISPECIES: hypothetical protein [Treponema]MBB5217966.1 hypothetical protein [Treponema rectale]MBE6353526.1 hypothetical protein [Treponema sp.]MBO6176364.1 hypothetical protein [Treponema sp.]QOS40317.1 hypothetical protein DYE49_07545 [Treponema rectale]
MDKRTKVLVGLLKQLVSNLQGAPYPGEDFEPELYRIWYEHCQKSAVDCFEYLEANFEDEKKEFSKSLEKMFK